MSRSKGFRTRTFAIWGLALAACCGLTGCTADYAGQSLPSGYFLSDDIQYFPAGPEFKLSREAAAQKEFRETQVQREGGRF